MNGKPHATEDDHISSDAASAAPLPTPPDSGARQSRSKRKEHASPPQRQQQSAAADVVNIEDDEPEREVKEDSDDYLRDPVSSDDEEDMAGKKGSGAGSSGGFVGIKPMVTDGTSAEVPKAQFKKAASSILEDKKDNVPKAAFRAPPVTSASIAGEKRVLNDQELDEESDDGISGFSFMSSSQPKKKRVKTSNIHAAPRSAVQKVFGSSQKEADDKRRREEEIARRKKEKKEKRASEDAGVPAAKFKRHNLPTFQAGSTTAGATNGVSNEDDCSSPLSSLSVSPEPDSMSIICETCHERVDKLLQEEYNDDYVKGKSWNIQWQERFCEWHRTQSAKEAWLKRRYPDIDWAGLESRMKQHDDFLLSVLRNQKKSQYRDEYAAKVKAKSMSGGFKDSTVKPGATVGYYGPKGEKAMYVCPVWNLRLFHANLY